MTETMKEFSPLEILENNAKGQRDLAQAQRADAEKSMRRAVDADRRAEQWEAAAKVLREASHDS